MVDFDNRDIKSKVIDQLSPADSIDLREAVIRIPRDEGFVLRGHGRETGDRDKGFILQGPGRERWDRDKGFEITPREPLSHQDLKDKYEMPYKIPFDERQLIRLLEGAASALPRQLMPPPPLTGIFEITPPQVILIPGHIQGFETDPNFVPGNIGYIKHPGQPTYLPGYNSAGSIDIINIGSVNVFIRDNSSEGRSQQNPSKMPDVNAHSIAVNLGQFNPPYLDATNSNNLVFTSRTGGDPLIIDNSKYDHTLTYDQDPPIMIFTEKEAAGTIRSDKKLDYWIEHKDGSVTILDNDTAQG